MSIIIVEECPSSFPSRRIKKIIQLALDKDCGQERRSLNIAVVTEEKIRSLNKKYRGRNRSAAVLSFSFLGQSDKSFILPKKETSFLGEIFLSPRDITRRAKKYGLSYQEQFGRLLVHGTLHLLGFSHKTGKEAEKMEELEEKIINDLD